MLPPISSAAPPSKSHSNPKLRLLSLTTPSLSSTSDRRRRQNTDPQKQRSHHNPHRLLDVLSLLACVETIDTFHHHQNHPQQGVHDPMELRKWHLLHVGAAAHAVVVEVAAEEDEAGEGEGGGGDVGEKRKESLCLGGVVGEAGAEFAFGGGAWLDDAWAGVLGRTGQAGVPSSAAVGVVGVGHEGVWTELNVGKVLVGLERVGAHVGISDVSRVVIW